MDTLSPTLSFWPLLTTRRVGDRQSGGAVVHAFSMIDTTRAASGVGWYILF